MARKKPEQKPVSKAPELTVSDHHERVAKLTATDEGVRYALSFSRKRDGNVSVSSLIYKPVELRSVYEGPHGPTTFPLELVQQAIDAVARNDY